ncbi:unnamed protein product [Fusarium equiseti]|uniref:DNA2/NAM7 helicase helicase domain-containing protein n=1 Tax=Fusarium equiseti TaxID=61235 RepID=A0A8J2INE9_FUSEQ|nr:unnamed protein product [Fusarium equiseti]
MEVVRYASPYPDLRSQQAYPYTLRFDLAEAEPEVDLVSEFEGIENVIVHKAAPAFIQEIYDNLPEPMQKCLTGMHGARVRMHFIAGVARYRISYLMASLVLFDIFGIGLEQPNKLKVLYIMNNNVGIETFYQHLTRTFRIWNFTDEQLDSVLNIMRLYPLDGEVHDIVTTDLVDELVTSENANRDKSLHQFALRTLEQNQDPQQYRELKQLLASVADGTRLGEGDFAKTKTNMKKLYRDTFNGFSGVVVTTPVGASPLLVRESFKPDTIIVDEAATMDEATLSIVITSERQKFICLNTTFTYI